MAYCFNCGAPLHPSAKFCAHCGIALRDPPLHVAALAPQAGPTAPPISPPAGAPPSAGSRVAQVFEDILRDIRSFSFKWVVPIDTALSPDFVRNRSVWVMLLFGFFPLIALTFQLVATLQGFAQLLEIYFALAWACYFYYFVARRSTDIATGAGVMFFTAFIGIQGVLAAQQLPGIDWLYAGLPGMAEGGDPVRALIGFVCGVGPVEETCKAVPVILLAFAMRKIEKPIDGIFYGAMSGLGFAITEGTGYIMRQDAGMYNVLIRGTSLPFLHALWSAIAGYFVALAAIHRSRGPALVVLGLLVAAVLHGLYDFTSSGMAGVLMCAFTYLLFVSYMERSQSMVAELQAAEKQAVERDKLQALWHQQYQGYALPVALTETASTTTDPSRGI